MCAFPPLVSCKETRQAPNVKFTTLNKSETNITLLLARYNLCHNKYTPLCHQRKCLHKKKIKLTTMCSKIFKISATNSDKLSWIIPQHLEFVFVKNVSGENIYPEFKKNIITGYQLLADSQYFHLQWIKMNQMNKKKSKKISFTHS